MKFNEFKKINNIEIKLLKYLGVLYERAFIFKLNNHPDYDFCHYDKTAEATYFFEYEADLPSDFNMVTSVETVENFIIHTNDIRNACENYHVVNNIHDREWTVNEIYKADARSLSCYSSGCEFDGFSLKKVEARGVINSTGKVLFLGAYVGNSEDIEPYDWDIYSECRIVGARAYFEEDEEDNVFYRELMAESYNLMLNKNFKLSYFLAFSSLESYINEKMGTHNEQKRLKDILSEMVRGVVGNLNENKIYSSIMSGYDDYETKRNVIAHGREFIQVTKEDVNELMLFVSLIICLAENKANSFSTLARNLADM